MLSVETLPDLSLAYMLRSPRVYLVPRTSTTLWVGASVYENGYDCRVNTGNIFRLLEAAWEIYPGLSESTFLEAFAGLRPATKYFMPYIGHSKIKGYSLATGHFRSGLLLAPYTAYVFKTLFSRSAHAHQL